MHRPLIIAAATVIFFAGCKKSTSEMSENAQDAIGQAEDSLRQASESLSSMKERVTSLQESVRQESERLARIANEELAIREIQLQNYRRRLGELPVDARAEADGILAEVSATLAKAKDAARSYAEAEPLDNRAQQKDLSEMLDQIDKKAGELQAKLEAAGS